MAKNVLWLPLDFTRITHWLLYPSRIGLSNVSATDVYMRG